MQTKKIPLRKCLATQQMYPKSELLRIVKTPSNEVLIDISGKVNGRGAYISRTREALTIAKKTNCLGRALEIEIPNEVYERLDKIIR